MEKPDRRQLLFAGAVLAVPAGSLVLLGGCQPSSAPSESAAPSAEGEANAATTKPETNPLEENRETKMQVHYLEIVTPEVDSLCKQYSAVHGVTFGDPDASLGNARTAKVDGGGMIGIRAPMRADEAPVVRPYLLVEDLEAAVSAAADAGAEVALPSMEIPGHGKIAIVIHGGIDCGFWQA